MEDIKIIRTVSGFAGFGGDKFAMQLAGIKYEETGFSEIDKYAIKCHKQNHKGKNLGSMTDINPDTLEDFDLFTGGFPCQKFSIAGKGEGAAAEDGGGLLFNEIIRICEVKQPKYILLENVKGLMSKKHSEFFEFTKSELKRIGYNIDVSLYNSKNYGIPQNRERVFYVCIRKDLPFDYVKPGKEELKIFLKDILEDKVDKKYYLKESQIQNLLNNKSLNCNPSGKGMNGKVHFKDIAPTITTNKGEGPKIIQLNNPKHSTYRVYSSEGISPVLRTMQGGNTQPFIQVKNATKQGYLEAKQGDGISLEHPNSETRRGRVQEQMSPTLQCNDSKGVIVEIINPLYISSTQKHNSINRSGLSNCLPSAMGLGGGHIPMVESNLLIRKLTPKECFRLMGFLDDQINLDGISNSQQYKIAGNGWEINLVSKIMKGFLSYK